MIRRAYGAFVPWLICIYINKTTLFVCQCVWLCALKCTKLGRVIVARPPKGYGQLFEATEFFHKCSKRGGGNANTPKVKEGVTLLYS